MCACVLLLVQVPTEDVGFSLGLDLQVVLSLLTCVFGTELWHFIWAMLSINHEAINLDLAVHYLFFFFSETGLGKLSLVGHVCFVNKVLLEYRHAHLLIHCQLFLAPPPLFVVAKLSR